MASDEIVWQIINQQHCSYKLKTTKDQTFCRNEYNVTGLCTRQSCPLANSRYATIRSNPESGTLYLYMKTIERAHMPSKLWERIKLPASSYAKALEIIDERLRYWPKFLIHKCKQRLTRLTQVAIRMKKLQREEVRLGEKMVGRLAPKVRRREDTRERKAESAAKVERAIERELVERLRQGAYGEQPLNVEEGIWKKVLRGLERSGDGMRDEDLDERIEEEDEVEGEIEKEYEDGDVEYVSDIEGQSESEEDLGDLEDWLGEESADEEQGDEDEDESGSSTGDNRSEKEDDEKLKKALGNLKRKRQDGPPSKPVKKTAKLKGPRQGVEYEYEIENEPPQLEGLHA